MPIINVKSRSGNTRSIEVSSGNSLMETLRDNGFDEILALCGGCRSCATCHVYVDAAFAARVPPKTDDEDFLLEGSSYLRETSRLSCQIPVTDELDGLIVEIAPED